MIRFYLRKAAIFLFNFFYLQLFLTVLSWPIMLWWGLPLSKAAFVGNLIFNPFLVMYLFISSLIFVCALFTIPYDWLTFLLDLLTKLWLYLTSFSSPQWLLGTPQPSLPFTVGIIVLALGIMYSKLIKHGFQKCAALLIFFMGTHYFLVWWYVPVQAEYSIMCGRKKLPIIIQDKQAFLIIPAHLNTRVNLTSWIEYTALPFLTQKTGKIMFDGVVIPYYSSQMLELIESLCAHKATQKIFIPVSEKISFEDSNTNEMDKKNKVLVQFYSKETIPIPLKYLKKH